MKRLSVLIGVCALCVTTAAANAGYVLTLEQVGSNVVATGSGYDEAEAKEKKEKALAEHVAHHPEDVGRTVEDFNWIQWTIVRPAA